MRLAPVSSRGCILIWSNEKDLRIVIKDVLEYEGYETIFASQDKSPKHRIAIAATVVDLPSHEEAQLSVVHSLWANFPETPMVILTGHNRDEQVLESICHFQSWEIIRKPYDSADLKQKLKAVIEKRSNGVRRTDPEDIPQIP